MKKKVLLSSIATIALCLCLIAGSTFALFTDTTSFNIAVTSGDVEIEAYASINSLWSAKGAETADDDFLVDENGHTYTHQYMGGEGSYFLNEGTATITGNNLEIVRITPGDRVDVNINVKNKSDVAFVYRYKIEAKETNLATGMVVTIDGESYEGLATWTSEWYPVNADEVITPATQELPVKTVSVELPVYAGNEYQSEHTENKEESVEYTITVEAVQGNAVTDDESIVTIFPAAFQKMLDKRDVATTNGATLFLNDALVLPKHDVTISNTVIDSSTMAPADGYTGENMYAVVNVSENGYRNTNLTLTDNTVIKTDRWGIFYAEGDHVLTINAGSSIEATGDGSTCLQLYVYDMEIYLPDTADDVTNGTVSLKATDGANPILVGTAANVTIYVTCQEVVDYYDPLMDDQTAVYVTWIDVNTGEEIIPAN